MSKQVALPTMSVPTHGCLPITPHTDGRLCTSRPAGPPALSVQAKCNPCLSSPCQNQGTCHNDPLGFYRCACPSGYKVPWSWGCPARGDPSLQRGRGQRGDSAIPLGFCPPSLHTAAHCRVGRGRGSGTRCCGTLLAPTSPSFFPQGRDCEVALSGCSSSPCANGGTCQPQEGEGAGFR